MSAFFGRKSTSTANTKRAVSRLMMTSALVAAGTFVLSTSSVAAPWENVTGAGVTNTSGGAGITNIGTTNANGKASGTGNLDILAGETVNINAKLFVARDNRDTIQTSILGNLKSNGTVVLIDKNGVVFGKDSRVDVGSLIATTGELINEDPLGNANTPLLFSNFGTGEIVNNGSIAASGLVAFVAPTVKNSSVINANLGRVSLAAGDTTATVDLYGDGLVEFAASPIIDANAKYLSENTGTITGRKIQMTAAAAKDVADSVVNMQGVLVANTAIVTNKGSIVLSAGTVKVGKASSTTSSVRGNTKITADQLELGLTVDGNISGAAKNVKILSDKAKIAQGLQAVTTGGTVDVAAGTYNEHLVINKEGVTLKGANADVAADGTRGAETIINPNSPGVTVTADNVTVNGLAFSGAAGLDGYGIYVNGADNVTLQSNAISNTSQHGIYALNSNGVKIIDNTIGGNVAGDGIRLLRSNDAVITGNVINGVGTLGTGYGSGIYVARSSGAQIGGAGALANNIQNTKWDGVKLFYADDTTVENNQIASVARAGVVVANSNGITVNDNDVSNTGMWGVWSWDASDLDIVGNNINGITGPDAEHGIHINGGSDVSITDNVIKNVALSGIYADNVGTLLGNALTVSGNTIDSTGGYGLWVSNSAGTSIIGNDIGTLDGASNIGKDGVRILFSNNSVIQSNKIENTKTVGTGIYSLFNDGIIIGGVGVENTVNNVGHDGIKVQGGSDAQVLGNFITNVGRAGVSFYQTTNATASDVTQIENSKLWGIWSARNNGLTIENVNINGTTVNEGIYSFDDANLLVGTAVISNTKGTGIYVEYAKTSTESPSVTLINNTINNTGSHGIHVYQTSNAVISDNFIGTLGGAANIKGDGIRGVFMDDSTVEGNTISNVAPVSNTYGSGVYVNFSNNVNILDNTISNIKFDGVKVGWGDGYVIDGNTADNIGRAGVAMNDTTNATVNDNTLTNLGKWGIWSVRNSGADITGNEITNVTQSDGISSDRDTDTKMSGNTISNVGGNGIYAVTSSNGLEISDNTIIGSAINGVYIKEAIGLVTVDGNTITDSAANGLLVQNTPSADSIELYVTGNTIGNTGATGTAAVNLDITSDGYAALSGNTLGNNFTYGLLGYSGTIDLTGATNTIQNTAIGMRFAPTDPTFLALSGNTIGTTRFIDQSQFFVDLDVGAMWDTVTNSEILIDGNNATYTLGSSTISPSTFGGVTQAEYDLLQLMLNDFNDFQDRGLFFLNILPEPTTLGAFDQKDVFRFFAIPETQAGSGSLRITGLPIIAPGAAGAGTGTGAGAGAASAVFDPNAIEPAAGEEGSNPTANNVADIQPAAGEETPSACWSDATASLGQGSAVTFNFGIGQSALLQDAANCGVGQVAAAGL